MIYPLRLIWFVVCLCLVDINTASAKDANPMQNLTAEVNAKGGNIALDGLDLLAEIGSFEIFRVGTGQRATLLSGPKIPPAQYGLLKGELALSVDGHEKSVPYTYRLRWIDPQTLRVQMTFQPDFSWPLGCEFCIGKLPASLFAGSLAGNGSATHKLPLTPKPFNDRWLFKDWPSLVLQSSFVDLKVVPRGGEKISLADFRQVPWDSRRSFYLYSSRKAIIPGAKVDFAFDLIFSLPTLGASEQFGRETLDPIAPLTVDPDAFFVRDGSLAPNLAVRGVITELLTPARKDVGIFKSYIRAIAKTGGNTLILYHRPEHVRILQVGREDGKWWTRPELSEIAIYARSLGITVIPGMTSKFSPKDFPRLSGNQENGFYNTFDVQSYAELFALYQTLIDLYQPKALLIGHDEIREIGRGKPAEWSDAQVLAADISKIAGWLRQKQIKTLIFGDMLLDRRQWPYPVAANSNNPKYLSTDTHDALEKLPKDVVILDWQYENTDDNPTIDYFRKKGFTVWGVAWNDPAAAVSLAKSLVRYKGEGILVSDWGFWRTLNPGALTLYGVKAGYDSRISVRGEGEDAAFALAEELRPPRQQTSKKPFQPFNLSDAVNATTRAERFGRDGGFVGLGSGFDLRALPSGDLVFAGVPFRLLPSVPGSNNCLIASVDHPAAIKLNGSKAAQLAFLQTMRSQHPQSQLKPAGSYEVIYTDNSRVTIPLVEGDNITDLRSGAGVRKNPWGYPSGADILLGSRLGWRGPSLSGTPLNLQVMIWENPYREKRIKKIKITPEKDNAISIIALSIGL